MKTIKASQKRKHGSDVFQIEILYPGAALGLNDTGFYTIGRIDHASFRPPGIVPMHLHRDDEILSYMRSGLQTHKDSAGHQQQISRTHLMMMNAGSGFSHEEIAEKEVEMLQIFMRPRENGLPPKVQFHEFASAYSENKWRLVAGDLAEAPLEIRTQTNIFDVRLDAEQQLEVPLADKTVVHLLYCFDGSITLAGQILRKGDSVVFQKERLSVKALERSNLVLFQIDAKASYSKTGMFSGNQYL